MTVEIAAQIKGFLGLCARAGQLIFGQEACVDAVRRHSAAVILLDADCSGNTRKRFMDACGTHRIPLYSVEGGEIAKAVGKDGRKVVGLKPGGMAQKILTLFKGEPILYSVSGQDQEG